MKVVTSNGKHRRLSHRMVHPWYRFIILGCYDLLRYQFYRCPVLDLVTSLSKLALIALGTNDGSSTFAEGTSHRIRVYGSFGISYLGAMFSLVFFGAVQKGETSSPALSLRKCFEKVNLKKKTKKDRMLFGVQGFGCSSLDISVCLEKNHPATWWETWRIWEKWVRGWCQKNPGWSI